MFFKAALIPILIVAPAALAQAPTDEPTAGQESTAASADADIPYVDDVTAQADTPQASPAQIAAERARYDAEVAERQAALTDEITELQGRIAVLEAQIQALYYQPSAESEEAK